jgi:superfamily II DNA/RNA helicase
MSFADLGLSPEVVKAVTDAGYIDPTPIQEQAIPQVLMGRDLLGCAQTGTGKTAGFTLPMIDILANGRARARMPRSLILEPTRELAAQVSENFDKYGKYCKLTMALLIGGVSFGDQEKLLDRGVDVLIATPGRLLDHFERGRILLNDVKILVIDEADRMLDMGFIPDVEKIVSLLPPLRQTLFFSATMPPEIKRLADAFLQNPREITVARQSTTAETVEQALVVVDDLDKRAALRQLLRSEEIRNAIIFCNRKRDVDIVGKSLTKHGFNAGVLHGDMNQSARTEMLERFKAGDVTVLVASDVAARGIDVAMLSHVFNFDVPIHAEDYVHRIGRTGRAGNLGKAFTFAKPDDTRFVQAIEAIIGRPIPRLTPEGMETLELLSDEEAAAERKNKRRRPERKSDDRRPSREPRAASAPRSGEGEQPAVTKTVVQAAPAQRRERDAERPDRAPRPERQPRERFDRPRRERPEREASERPEREFGERPVNDRPVNERPERDFRDRPRRDYNDREHYRRDDLGPSVQGFGDHVPAFMLRVPPAA